MLKKFKTPWAMLCSLVRKKEILVDMLWKQLLTTLVHILKSHQLLGLETKSTITEETIMLSDFQLARRHLLETWWLRSTQRVHMLVCQPWALKPTLTKIEDWFLARESTALLKNQITYHKWIWSTLANWIQVQNLGIIMTQKVHSSQ